MICIFSDYYVFHMEMTKAVAIMRIETAVVKRVAKTLMEVSVIIKSTE